MRKIIFILVLLSWCSQFFHRVFSDDAPTSMYFPYTKTVTDLQWYAADIGMMASIVFLLSALLLYIASNLKRDKSIFYLILTYLVIQVLDIAHYVLWFKQSEIVFYCENIIMIIGLLLILYRYGHKQKTF